MGSARARPAPIRAARSLNKSTGAGFLLGRLTRSAHICLVLIIIDKLQQIMCGAGRGCSSSPCPRPWQMLGVDLCRGSDGTSRLSPPENGCSSPIAL